MHLIFRQSDFTLYFGLKFIIEAIQKLFLLSIFISWNNYFLLMLFN